MKALVFEEPRRAAVRELDIPTIAADEVLVRSRNVGICHSDFELYEGRYIIPVSYPIIPGHEWSGEVADVGGAVPGGLQGARRRRRHRRERCGRGDRWRPDRAALHARGGDDGRDRDADRAA